MRIEVGDSFEGVLTDAATRRIIRNVIAPQFKAGKFHEGVAEGIAPIIGQ